MAFDNVHHGVYHTYMIRTQIYLTKSQQNTIKKLSQERQTNASEVIRFAIDQLNQKRKKPSPKYKTFAETLEEVKKMGLKTRGEKNLSGKIDYYLYGRKD